MGVVYRAHDPEHQRTVALKTTRSDTHAARHAEMLEHFRNEGRAAGVLNHRNIVTIFEAGEAAGLLYIAMEFIDGKTLAQILARTRLLPIENVVSLVSQVCHGLDYAHSKGVIHRDIKPANIMVSNPDEFASTPSAEFVAKITDFGIADSHGAPQAGQVVGTPHYMSPEHVRGKTLDGRSDLFSLGVILYEMLTGEKPFDGHSVTTIIYKVVHEQPLCPRELDARIHPGISAIVTKALAKPAEDRFQSGKEFAAALQNYQSWTAPKRAAK